MPLPPRRPMEERLIEHDDQPAVVLRDSEGLIDGEMVVPIATYLVYMHLDGKRDLDDVGAALIETTRGRLKIPREVLQNIVDELDKHFLLENERSAAKRANVVEKFQRASVRPARFMKGSAVQVGDLLEGTFRAKEGAGLPAVKPKAGSLRGIVAPHIDFQRGGHCYSHAYRQVAESAGADTYVILGVAHRSPPSPFVLSGKSFATAFGPAEADEEFVDALTKRTGAGVREHEIAHLTEHSVEFQAVYLKFARRERAPFRIVPILCSSFASRKAAGVEDFIGALGETIRSCGKSVCIVAGVDFAHVGPHFGDDVKVDETLVDWMCGEDKKSLGCVTAGDAEAFWESVTADGNKRHVCGLTATYTALRLLGPAPGELLSYGYAPDPSGGLVSFAAAVFR